MTCLPNLLPFAKSTLPAVAALAGLVWLAFPSFQEGAVAEDDREPSRRPRPDRAGAAESSAAGTDLSPSEGLARETVSAASGADQSSPASERLLALLGEMEGGNNLDVVRLHRLIETALPGLPSRERGRLFQELGRWFARHAEGQAHAMMDRFAGFADRSQFAAGLVAELLSLDPGRAVAWAAGVPQPEIAGLLHRQIARTWARHDLVAARDWVTTLPESQFRAEALEGILFSWTQQDREAAFDWVMQGEPGDLRDRGLAMMVKVIANTDPEAAARWAAQLPESPAALESLGYAVQAWARRDLDAPILWLQSLGQGEAGVAETVLRAVPLAWSGAEPAAAANWVMAWEGMAHQKPVLQGVVAKWGQRHPTAAMAWLEEFPERFPGHDLTLRNEMVRDLFENAASKEPTNARTLLDAMTSSDLKEIARQAIDATLPLDERTDLPLTAHEIR